VNAEFIVWALVVGLVLGAGLVWLVIMDSRRRELDVEAVERPLEAAWLSAVMAEDGYDVSPEAAERLLDLHGSISRRRRRIRRARCGIARRRAWCGGR
jgi:hypothetical protein